MIADLRRTLIHGTPSPVSRDDAFAAELAVKFGGEWDVWADVSTPGRVLVHIAGPGGTTVESGTWLDALDLAGWERRQMAAARSVSSPQRPGSRGDVKRRRSS